MEHWFHGKGTPPLQMMKTPEDVRALTSELGTSVWSLAALGVLFESSLIDQLRREPHPTLDVLAKDCPSLSREQIEKVLGVARALGIVVVSGDGRYALTEAAQPFASPPMRTAFTGDMRSTLMQATKFFNTASTGAGASKGWDHIDPRVLQAQGDASSVLASMLVRQIIPTTLGNDFAARMARPGACFLDAGVGVGSISIALCRLLPEMRAIGIDIYEPALALARKNVEEANLTDRITLRREPLDSIQDDAIVDLAWLPSFFIPTSGTSVVARLHRALKKDGWLIVGLDNGSTNPRNAAVSGLINSLWGGGNVLSIAEGESLLKGAGFTDVQTMRGPDWAPAMVLGRRSLAG
jgi:SAM-dependent methyltransferase